MSYRFALWGVIIGLGAGIGSLSAQNVLFVGNSLTYVPRENLKVGKAVELNGGPGGGVPGLFEALAVAGGKTPVVSMETVAGRNLAFHYASRRTLIDQSWDVVVLQDFSTSPQVERASPPTSLEKLRDVVVARNPRVKVYVYETWRQMDRLKNEANASVESLHADLHGIYTAAVKDFGLSGRAPVGCAFAAAVREGLADDPMTEAVEGSVKIWGKDNLHQSDTGSYLAALVFYGRLYGEDPRKLPADNPVAVRLRMPAKTSERLQAIAWEALQADPL